MENNTQPSTSLFSNFDELEKLFIAGSPNYYNKIAYNSITKSTYFAGSGICAKEQLPIELDDD